MVVQHYQGYKLANLTEESSETREGDVNMWLPIRTTL